MQFALPYPNGDLKILGISLMVNVARPCYGQYLVYKCCVVIEDECVKVGHGLCGPEVIYSECEALSSLYSSHVR